MDEKHGEDRFAAPDADPAVSPAYARLGHKRLTLLAFGMWVAYAAIETWIMRTVTVMPWVWAASGLLLMLSMKAALDRAPAHTPLRIVLFVLIPIAMAALQSVIDILLTNTIGLWAMEGLPGAPRGFQIDPRGVEAQIVFKLNLRTYLWLFGFYAAVIAMTAAAEREHRARVGELTARLAAQKSELAALQLQVNPHHLFNALNSLTALISAGRLREAENFAVGLGDHYRSSFTTAEGAASPLMEEVDEAHAYVELLSYRVQGLSLEVDLEAGTEDIELPARMLLPLVENAVKYGAVGRVDPVISLKAFRDGADLVVELSNPLSATPDESGAGTGLNTARRRLSAAYGGKASLTSSEADGGWKVVLRIPAT